MTSIDIEKISAESYTRAEAHIQELGDVDTYPDLDDDVDMRKYAIIEVYLRSDTLPSVGFAVIYEGKAGSYLRGYDFSRSFLENQELLINDGKPVAFHSSSDPDLSQDEIEGELERVMWDIIGEAESLWDKEARALLPEPEQIDAHLVKTECGETHVVERLREPLLRFNGHLLAQVRTSPNNAHPDYSGLTGRWHEFAIYRTVSDRYVVTWSEYTQWQGEHDTHDARLCDTVADITQYLGYGDLAKRLYSGAGIDVDQAVDRPVAPDETQSDRVRAYIVSRDNQPDLRFTGSLLGAASSSPNNAHPDYSRSPGRWMTLALYETTGGTMIAEKIGYTQWANEDTRFSAAICEDDAAVRDFFGHGWLAKRLYNAVGIENVEDIA